MARWSRENTFDAVVASESAAQGVEAALIKAIIGAESAFVPTARRAEPKIHDASYGLMQILYGTAQKLGYGGTPEGLLDPATNIHYGTALLAENLNRTNGDIPRAVSAYNGGFREALGFGRQLPSGQFRNQEYVTRVLRHLAYFRGAAGTAAGPPAPDTPTPTGAAITQAVTGSGLLLGLALLGILWYLRTH